MVSRSTTSPMQQLVTPQLRQWIIAQAEAGCRPEDVLAAMRASGWDDGVAQRALEETMSRHLERGSTQIGRAHV